MPALDSACPLPADQFPWAFLSLIPANIIGEMWIGVTLTIVMESVPSHLKAVSVAIYLFIITNIGGNAPILVSHALPHPQRCPPSIPPSLPPSLPAIAHNLPLPPLLTTFPRRGAPVQVSVLMEKSGFNIRNALLIMYPGVYALASAFFASKQPAQQPRLLPSFLPPFMCHTHTHTRWYTNTCMCVCSPRLSRSPPLQSWACLLAVTWNVRGGCPLTEGEPLLCVCHCVLCYGLPHSRICVCHLTASQDCWTLMVMRTHSTTQ